MDQRGPVVWSLTLLNAVDVVDFAHVDRVSFLNRVMQSCAVVVTTTLTPPPSPIC